MEGEGGGRFGLGWGCMSMKGEEGEGEDVEDAVGLVIGTVGPLWLRETLERVCEELRS